MNQTNLFALTLLVSLSTSELSGLQAFAEEKAVRALSATRSLKCTFPWYSSADWDSDEPKVKSAGQQFAFHIDSIDRNARRARLIGNVAAEDLAVTYGTDTISFIEVVPVGTVNLTTVYAWRDRAGRFKVSTFASHGDWRAKPFSELWLLPIVVVVECSRGSRCWRSSLEDLRTCSSAP